MKAPDEIVGPINLGNPTELTVFQLAEMVIELVGSKSIIEYRPLPQDDPMQRCPDISRAKDKLNWTPTVEVKEGLRKTIDHFTSNMQ